MSLPLRQPRIAVLIDAENVSSAHAETIFRKAAELGNATIRRAYGDFSNPPQGWTGEVLGRFAVTPRHNAAITKGFAGSSEFQRVPAKNAADISLVIDAMDMLHGRQAEAFLLVSSDSDFTRLATRLREEGIAVWGAGVTPATTALASAFTQFFRLDNELPVQPDPLADVFLRVSRVLRLVRDSKTMRANVAQLCQALRDQEPDLSKSGYLKSGKFGKLLDTLNGCERQGNDVWLTVEAS